MLYFVVSELRQVFFGFLSISLFFFNVSSFNVRPVFFSIWNEVDDKSVHVFLLQLIKKFFFRSHEI